MKIKKIAKILAKMVIFPKFRGENNLQKCLKLYKHTGPRNFLTICTWHKSILCRCTDMFHNRRMTDFPKEMLIFEVTPHGPKIPSWWFSNPFEKYAQVKIGSFQFPQFSGWKFQKYLSCHHHDSRHSLRMNTSPRASKSTIVLELHLRGGGYEGRIITGRM